MARNLWEIPADLIRFALVAVAALGDSASCCWSSELGGRVGVGQSGRERPAAAVAALVDWSPLAALLADLRQPSRMAGLVAAADALPVAAAVV